MPERSVHLGELGRSTAGDLLHTEPGEFLLEFVELLGQVGLGLGPELRCLDGGGLKNEKSAFPLPSSVELISRATEGRTIVIVVIAG